MPIAPLPGPSPWSEQPGHLSPYIGQIGSWNGAGMELDGSIKTQALDETLEAGLHWTFMPLYWSALEPEGPVDLSQEPLPPAWQDLDAFFLETHALGLNVLVQTAVVGGNNGGPPAWAGEQARGQSAPEDMDALAAFTQKVAERYAPNGTLWSSAGIEDWGVQAWELENEPSSYRTNWSQQPEAFAAFAVDAAQAIRGVDPDAQIVLGALASGTGNLPWWEAVLADPSDPGPQADVISFHNYEGMDSIGRDRRSKCVLSDIYSRYNERMVSTGEAPTDAVWHTEGSVDFLHRLPGPERANWRMQWSVRLFAMGAHKLTFKDPDPEEIVVQALLSEHLPLPWPMLDRSSELGLPAQGGAFQHPTESGAVWVVWPENDQRGETEVVLDVANPAVRVFDADGSAHSLQAEDGRVRLSLKGSGRYSQTVLVSDQPGW